CANCLRAPRLLSNLSSFIKSTIEFFQSRSSRCSAASLARIPSTSAFEIGFPADADAAGDEGDAEDDPPAPVTLAACLEPKMADTMLPKTLISFLPLLLLLCGQRRLVRRLRPNEG